MTQNVNSKTPSKSSIRRQMREKRLNLPRGRQLSASRQLKHNAASGEVIKRSKLFACYLPNDGEIATDALILRYRKMGKRIYLPVLHPIYANRLWFASYKLGDKLKANRFGISEPDIRRAKRISPWALQCVFLPLVAFDDGGNRLGMGGGFYDRTFETKRTSIRCPRLVGVAHHFQQVSELPSDSWDIPLTSILTDISLHQVKSRIY